MFLDKKVAMLGLSVFLMVGCYPAKTSRSKQAAAPLQQEYDSIQGNWEYLKVDCAQGMPLSDSLNDYILAQYFSSSRQQVLNVRRQQADLGVAIPSEVSLLEFSVERDQLRVIGTHAQNQPNGAETNAASVTTSVKKSRNFTVPLSYADARDLSGRTSRDPVTGWDVTYRTLSAKPEICPSGSEIFEYWIRKSDSTR